MTQRLLSDIRVIDLTWHIAGPYATKLLADYGADVIKIERPGTGDPARSMGPFHHDHPHPEKSGLFLHLNTNKRSLTLNLKSEQGKKVLKELVKTADLLVESFSPRVMPSLGLDYTTLSQVNPKLLMASVSNFGQTGPYRDWRSSELVAYAMGGPMNATGSPDREPIKPGANLIQFMAGSAAAIACMTGIFGARARGHGEHVDFSIMEALTASQDRRTTFLIHYQFTGDTVKRAYPVSASVIASGIRPTADGYINLRGGANFFPRVAQMLGMPELLKDPRFATLDERMKPERVPEFDEIFIPWLMERTTQEVWEACQQANVLSGPLYTPADLFADQNYRERGYWEDIVHPFTGKVTYPGLPFRFHGMPRHPRHRAPLLGEHNADILCGELGHCRSDLVLFRETGII